MKNLLKKLKIYLFNRELFKRRIFWKCTVVNESDGWYYHQWSNWFIDRSEIIFAGYSRFAMNNKDTTFRTVTERINE